MNDNEYLVKKKSQNSFILRPREEIKTRVKRLLNFINYNPIKMLSQEMFVGGVEYADENEMIFRLSGLQLAEFQNFIGEDNIFMSNKYGSYCFRVIEVNKPFALDNKNSLNTHRYFIIQSYIDMKIVKGFFGGGAGEKMVLSKKNIVRINYYNHSFETGQNEVLIGGYAPLEGSYLVYKKDKDSFYIVSQYKSDNLVYRKNRYNQLDIYITSDYNGFYSEIRNNDFFGNSRNDINFEGFPYILCCSKEIGGNMANIYHGSERNEITNLFARFNMPEKLTRDTKMIFDRHVQSTKTYAITPLRSLSKIDFQFYYPNGVPYDFQQVEHSFVLLIREYYDTNINTGYSTKRGVTDNINVFQYSINQQN